MGVGTVEAVVVRQRFNPPVELSGEAVCLVAAKLLSRDDDDKRLFALER